MKNSIYNDTYSTQTHVITRVKSVTTLTRPRRGTLRSLMRMAALAVTAALAVVLILSDTDDAGVFVVTKTAGAVCGAVYWALYVRWVRRDTLVRWYHRWCMRSDR